MLCSPSPASVLQTHGRWEIMQPRILVSFYLSLEVKKAEN